MDINKDFVLRLIHQVIFDDNHVAVDEEIASYLHANITDSLQQMKSANDLFHTIGELLVVFAISPCFLFLFFLLTFTLFSKLYNTNKKKVSYELAIDEKQAKDICEQIFAELQTAGLVNQEQSSKVEGFIPLKQTIRIQEKEVELKSIPPQQQQQQQKQKAGKKKNKKGRKAKLDQAHTPKPDIVVLPTSTTEITDTAGGIDDTSSFTTATTITTTTESEKKTFCKEVRRSEEEKEEEEFTSHTIINSRGRGATGESQDVYLRDVSISVKGEELLAGVTLHFMKGHKYGLIGSNGSGKTTLLRRIYLRKIAGFPLHLSTLHVQQEVEGTQQSALEVCFFFFVFLLFLFVFCENCVCVVCVVFGVSFNFNFEFVLCRCYVVVLCGSLCLYMYWFV